MIIMTDEKKDILSLIYKEILTNFEHVKFDQSTNDVKTTITISFDIPQKRKSKFDWEE